MGANRVYPPQLEGTLPAFYKDYEFDSQGNRHLKGCSITIPFGINRAVSMKTIDGLVLRIRTTSTNTYLAADYPCANYDRENNTATFKFVYDEDDEDTDTTAKRINEGQYYRVQVAFVQDNVIGYYSTVGIIKCIAKPTVQIGTSLSNNALLEVGEINQFDDDFYMLYTQDTSFGDSTEKVYSYNFEILDKLDNVLHTSGEKIHDVTQDTFSDSSTDYWKIYFDDFVEEEIYRIRCTVTTLNGLIITSPEYKCMRVQSVDCEYKLKLLVEPNYDNGYMKVGLQGELIENTSEYDYFYKNIQDLEIDYDDNTIQYYIKENNTYIEYVPIHADQPEVARAEWENLKYWGQLFIKEYKTYWGEQRCIGNFVITRASSKDGYKEWLELIRFTLNTNDLPSDWEYPDYTIEQGVQYIYALQQMNVHGIKSIKIKSKEVAADFEDMFLSDGIRNLKVRFNPKVNSFKNSIPEQKIETIGSKYPFIFRNGSVCYKEFPIGGLISFQMDDAKMFLNIEEQKQARILEDTFIRKYTNKLSFFYMTGHDGTHYKVQKIVVPIYYYDDWEKKTKFGGYRTIITDHLIRNDKIIRHDYSKTFKYKDPSAQITDKNEYPEQGVIRADRNLTGENIYGERYFKLKVLDWLTNGEVKLFRSPTEGSYLVRLLNVSLQPQDPLGRMLHSFTCTAYEIDELTSENLRTFGISTPKVYNTYEKQWASLDINEIVNNFKPEDPENWDGFYPIFPTGVNVETIEIQDFAPGDQIRVVYETGPDGLFTIGVTGTLELNGDERPIVDLYLKPNPDILNYNDFSRTLLYRITALRLTEFDVIKDYHTHMQVAEQFIGPADNLLEPYILRDNVYGIENDQGVVDHPLMPQEAFDNVYGDIKAHKRFSYQINKKIKKFTALKVEILHVHRKNVIPIYCYTNERFGTQRFGITPFGQPYVNSTDIINFVYNDRSAVKYVDNVLSVLENGEYVRLNGVAIEDIPGVLDQNGIAYTGYDLLEPYYYDYADGWLSFKDFSSVTDNGHHGYFDLYTKTWWSPNIAYDPTFSINNLHEFTEEDGSSWNIIGDNNISLLEINDILMYNLDMPEQLHLGNGVVAEVTVRMHEIEYDIEDSDPATKECKEIYENKKSELDILIDNAMTKVQAISDAEEEYAKLLLYLNELELQIQTAERGGTASSGILSIAAKRMIDQKRKLWYTLQEQINDILEILSKQDIFLNINSDHNDIVRALDPETLDNLYDYDDETVSEQDFEEKELGISNSFYLYQLPSPQKTVTVRRANNTTTTERYNIIDTFHPYYAKEQETKRDNAQAIIEKSNQQITVLRAQQGNLVGGFLSDYSETNPPPENTKVYDEYYIEQINQQLADLYEAMLNEKSQYLNQLFEYVLTTLETDLTTYTDNYIINTAGTLYTLLNGYRSQLLIDKDTILQTNDAKNTTKIENLIASIENVLDILNTMRNSPTAWQKARNSDKLISDMTVSPQINTALQNLFKGYNSDVTKKINTILSSKNTGNTLDDLLSFTSETSVEDRVFVLLKVLTDEYNKTPSNNLKTYLKEYYLKNQNQPTADDIIIKINNIQAAYDKKKIDLEKQKEAYEEEANQIQNQIDEIGKTITAITITRDNAQEQFDNAVQSIRHAEDVQYILDSEDLINRIVSIDGENPDYTGISRHQGNVKLAIQYIEWLEQQQSKLLDQIGQIFANLEKGTDYAKMLLKYIDAYEVEAFQFLHFYDALEADLHSGFDGTGGIDWLYYQPTKYWLSSYKDIFLLSSQGQWSDEERKYIYDQDMLANLSNISETVRKQTYNELKEELTDLLLGENKNVYISLLRKKRDMTYQIPGTPTEYDYRLVQIAFDSGDIIYPNIYELDDLRLEHPLSFDEDSGIELVPDMLRRDTETNSSRLRVLMPKDVNGVSIYTAEKRALGYYTDDSTYPDNLINIFGDRDLSTITNADVHAAATQAAANGKHILWLTQYPPIQVPMGIHTGLFDSFSYIHGFGDPGINPNLFAVSRNYHTYFEHMLGLIVHDKRNEADEYGSWMGLKELDIVLWSEITKYLNDYIKYSTVSTSTDIELEAYEEKKKRVRQMQDGLNQYTEIMLQCKSVLKNYDTQQISDDTPAKRQLLALLANAEEQVAYYQQWYNIYSEDLANFLNQNIELKEYLLYETGLPNAKENIAQIQRDYKTQFEIYEKKVKHYLYLLFNDEPYGHKIDPEIISDQSIMSIDGNTTNMYNFGLAYALEAYKMYKDNDDPINFGVVIDSINQFNSLLNDNFDFIFPIPKYQLVPENTQRDLTARYFYKTGKYTYSPYEYIDDETWYIDLDDQKIYVYDTSRINYDTESGAKKYYIYENGKFSPYIWVDLNQWNEDRNNYDIWYTYYPSLIDFAGKTTYRLINELDTYDSSVYYYTLQNGEYILTTITPENWSDYIGNIYVKVGNGGLKGFLNNLLDGSFYIESIKAAYKGTLDLYYSLYAESLGESTSLENLKTIQAKTLLRQKELEDIIQYKDMTYFDFNQKVDELQMALADYLIALTNAYINLVERSYRVV